MSDWIEEGTKAPSFTLNMYGKKSMGIQRSTFLIDSLGKVAKVWKRVKTEGHDQQVIQALQDLAKA